MVDIKNEKKKMGRPRKFTNADELFITGMEYIEQCIEKGEPLTVTGLCLALDTQKETFRDYESGKYNDKDNDFSAPIKRLKLIVENGYEKLLYTGKPTGGIFALKNFGWRDEQIIVNESNSENLSLEEIERQLKELGYQEDN